MPDHFGSLAPPGALQQPTNESWMSKLAGLWPARIAKAALEAAMLPGDVYAGRVDPLSDDAIGRSTDLAGLAMLGTTGAPFGALGSGFVRPKPQAVAAPEGIRAYHGSPHDFDKFDLGKIGTGEGAQSYGHGLYFAENEAVAKSYRDASHISPSFWFHGDEKLTSAANNAAQILSDNKFDKQKALEQIRLIRTDPRREGYFGTPESRIADAKYLDKTEFEVNRLDPNKLDFRNPGKMYEVNLRAKPEEFLDWDKPLSGQSALVQDFLREQAVSVPGNAPGPRRAGKHIATYQAERDAPGSDIYRALSQSMVKPDDMRVGFEASSPFAAASALRDAGIPGLRYLDQGSRDAGKGTSNYVVFNPEIIDILKKYGIVGGAAIPFGFAPNADDKAS